ncbi:MAG TPA: serine/threonine-protein kinase [Thermoanaerobaculia bacterium]|jgi:serine/threonine-protein kinase|nr:serine/threonine-protein kinase [Thermoanaerobaculia bacterium]
MEPAWNQVDRLFAEALDRPTVERPAFLDAACAGDAALRAEVEQLLAADVEGCGFLESPPDGMLRLTLDDHEESGSLGPYRLLGKIGSGGMGTVYLARREDEHYRRDVAIKVLHFGLANTQAFHRFVAERQILARLEHPNVARLYDGGSTDDGRPYLVMERVDGLPVDEYCDRQRLTLEQRLVLFQKICAAVQYAHQNLLVHRDLKPANILITPEGEPKLLDFGIAKQLAPEADDTLLRTRIGLRLLTPRYASPEQILGAAITTASDVYSLGIILYELLAGRSPYLTSTEPQYEIERAICEKEPERPSLALLRPGPPSLEEIAAARKLRPQSLVHRLSGDLDNIVLMALRKEPGRRYGSASQLSLDLDKHLQNLPVTARADTLRYRVRKFTRRHTAAVAATAAVVLLVAGFVASLIAQRRKLGEERDKARYALSFLVDTFKQADPYQTKGESLTARDILDQGADRVSREVAGQPDVQAAVMDAIGEVNLGLGRYAEAEPLLVRSLALRRQASGASTLDVADSLEHLADLHNERSDRPGAAAYLREALAIRRLHPGDNDLAVARTLNRLGAILVAQGVSPGAAPEIETIHREALAIARRMERPEGLVVTETLFALAALRSAQASFADAERLVREGLAIERKTLGDRDPRFWRDRSKLGSVFFDAGKFKEAEALARQNLRVQQKLLGPEHPDVTSTRTALAASLQLQGGRYAEVEALEREILAHSRAQYGPTHWRVAEAMCNLAASLTGQRKGKDEAIALYQQALDIRRRTLGPAHWEVGQLLLLLAEIYRHDEQLPKALGLAREAHEIMVAAEGPDHPYVAHALGEIGRNYLARDRFAEAEPYLRRCLEIRRRKLASPHPDRAKAQIWLASSLIGQRRFDEAAALLHDARAALLAVYGGDLAKVRTTDEMLADIERARTRRKSG